MVEENKKIFEALLKEKMKNCFVRKINGWRKENKIIEIQGYEKKSREAWR